MASIWHKATSKVGAEFHHSTSLPSGFVEHVTSEWIFVILLLRLTGDPFFFSATAGHTYTVITSSGGPAITLTKGKHGEVTSFAVSPLDCIFDRLSSLLCFISVVSRDTSLLSFHLLLR